jgi:hypothetical protein
MKLLIIDPDSQEIELNKEWLYLVPEFEVLLRRDKGSPRDYRGDKKLKARKEITYIYFMEDFASSIRDWKADEKKAEALRCASLEEKDIDKEIVAAQLFFREYQRKCARALRTLDSLYMGMDALDKYFSEVDFEKKDSLKRSVYTAKDYIDNVKNLPKMNAAIKEYEKMVEQELKEQTGIRGKNSLGITEGQRKQGWTEGGPPADDIHSRPREITEVTSGLE